MLLELPSRAQRCMVVWWSLCIISVSFVLTIPVAFHLTGCCDFRWVQLSEQHLSAAHSLQGDYREADECPNSQEDIE